MIVNMLFPGGKAKAFTLSYDDGVESDFRLADLMRKNSVKGTFNINSGIKRIREDLDQPDFGKPRCRMNRRRFLEFFEKNSDIAEIAAHGLTHASLPLLDQGSAIWELISDRKNLEDMLGIPCRGLAYAYGTHDEKSVEAVKACGFRYARTTKTTGDFSLPSDPLRWACTCHHKNPKLMDWARAFVDADEEKEMKIPYFFSVWGHSYEFNQDDNWNVIEELLECVGNRDNIWYCTNIEFFNYLRAYHSLEFFTDHTKVYNPAAVPVTLRVMLARKDPIRIVTVNPGELAILDPRTEK